MSIPITAVNEYEGLCNCAIRPGVLFMRECASYREQICVLTTKGRALVASPIVLMFFSSLLLLFFAPTSLSVVTLAEWNGAERLESRTLHWQSGRLEGVYLAVRLGVP